MKNPKKVLALKAARKKVTDIYLNKGYDKALEYIKNRYLNEKATDSLCWLAKLESKSNQESYNLRTLAVELNEHDLLNKYALKRSKKCVSIFYKAGCISISHQLLNRFLKKLPASEFSSKLIEKIQSSFRILNQGIELKPSSKLQAYEPNYANILIVTASSLPYTTTGYTLRTHSVIKALKEKGLNVTCATRPGYPFDSDLSNQPTPKGPHSIEGITYETLDSVSDKSFDTEKYFLQAAEIIALKAMEINACLIQAPSNYQNALPALLAARKLGIPFIYEVRGLWEYTKAARERDWEQSDQFKLDCILESLTANNADHVFTLTQALAEELVSRGCDKSRITLTANAVDITSYQPVKRDTNLTKSLKISDENFTIGYIGSIVNYEGLDDLIIAFSNIIKIHKHVKLLIVGDGIVLEKLKLLTSDLNLSKQINFIGKVESSQVHKYYSIIDTIVLPRKPYKVCQLVSPLKPFEVMAMEVPLIISDVAAMKEMVIPGKTALVFESSNIMGLTKTLSLIITNDSLRNNLLKTAKNHVAKNNTWDQIASKMQKTYSKLEIK